MRTRSLLPFTSFALMRAPRAAGLFDMSGNVHPRHRGRNRPVRSR
jgi:hypothetical protein